MATTKQKDTLTTIKNYIESQNNKAIKEIVTDMHPTDIADILDEVDFTEAIYVLRLLQKSKTSDVLLEVENEVREKILSALSTQEIASDVIDEMDTDDAADIIAELPEDIKEDVLNQLEDKEHAKYIVDLLRYEEDTAGGLMAKELIKVNHEWTVLRCVKEMHKQAQEVEEVNTIYVVNNDNVLLGTLSLKKLLTTTTRSEIKNLYNKKIYSINVESSAEEVASIIQKYDLFTLPVIDSIGTLVGVITLDDVLDFILEEAEKDYQLASGISRDVDAKDSILELTRARIPWLFLGLIGGVFAAYIMESFEDALEMYATLFMFSPLIAAMAGNVGVQSSAIIVQGLANDDLKGSTANRLLKELLLAMVNGLILSILLFCFNWFWRGDILMALAISCSLFTVIIMAGLIGTFIPIFLNKKGIDPALATGPFITTSNDIFGILIYFSIAKLILGF